VRARDVWRIPEPFLEQAQDDATLVAIAEMERAGIDILTDGEIRRESYSNRFATALDGIDLDQPGKRLSRSGRPDIVPRIVGPIRRRRPVEVRDVAFLRAHTQRPIKITLPGPFTMTQQAVDDYYADVIQIDEPYLQARADQASQYAIRVINRALQDVQVTTVLHTCFGYGLVVPNKQVGVGYPFLEELVDVDVDQISIEAAQPDLDLAVLERMGDKTMVVGVLDLGTVQVETLAVVEGRIRTALRHISPDRLVIAPDCGMKYLPRTSAFAKLEVMARAARNVASALPIVSGGGSRA
jgi:5-methyltetrahydropteroyltriglutamate--homocysteine methyltransferase